jgi:phytoene dehydrogenase-like protein
MKNYDAIIIGAGHNALVTAAYLARAGKSVLVLERRSITGGICVTESLLEGLQVESVSAGGFLRPDIVRDLNLARFGLPPASAKSRLVSLLPDSRRLVLSGDLNETTASIASFSKSDAAKWPGFVAFMDKAAAFLEAAYRTGMPRLPKLALVDGLPLAGLGLKLRGMGARDMYATIRLLPMTVREFLDEWFESDILKAAIASLGIHNANLGVMSAGSAYNLLHQYLLRGGWGQAQVPGGLGQIPTALAAAVQSYGAEIRVNAEVTNILVKDSQTSGVLLASGEEIHAGCVISSADPKRTFLKLIAPEYLDPEFVWKIQNIKMRGVSAKVHLALDVPLDFPAGTLVIAPGLNHLEQAYDAAKYGQISEKPYLEITTVGQVVSVHMQFAPYHLKGANWDEVTRHRLELLVINTVDEYIPGLSSKILKQRSITPLELESTYALSEGDPQHGQLLLDQFFFMRPLPGWSNHKTPVAGLFLCGSGVHGGGGISGISGRNAARQVLRTK